VDLAVEIFGEPTPYHLVEANGFPLLYLEGVVLFVSLVSDRRIEIVDLPFGLGIVNELQVELIQVLTEFKRLLNTELEQLLFVGG